MNESYTDKDGNIIYWWETKKNNRFTNKNHGNKFKKTNKKWNKSMFWQ